MSEPDVDVAICGAGPVGAACALFLRERGVAASRIALIDARGRDDAAADARMIAISIGSARLLSRLGAWRDGIDPRATAIESIHVSHRGRFGQTRIDREDYGVPALGYVIRHGDLTGALDAAASRAGLAVQRPVRVTGIEPDGSGLRLSLVAADGSTTSLSARHAIHAEGGLFDGQQRRAIHRDYRQGAVTAFVTLVEPPAATLSHTAFERFTEDGPIALLPSVEPRPDGSLRAGYSLVWCGTPADSDARIAMPDDAFVAALHAAFGDRLGPFATVGPRRAYPLGLNAVTDAARARSATAAEFAIGNAAQTLHPVAGQGLNLGLRDAHDVAALLGEALLGGRPIDAPTLVSRHAAARRVDRAATVNLTDLLPRIFASRSPPVAWGRGLTLALLDVATPLRGLFARQMMNGRR